VAAALADIFSRSTEASPMPIWHIGAEEKEQEEKRGEERGKKGRKKKT